MDRSRPSWHLLAPIVWASILLPIRLPAVPTLLPTLLPTLSLGCSGTQTEGEVGIAVRKATPDVPPEVVGTRRTDDLVRPGDVLLEIDGITTEKLAIDEVQRRLQGPAESEVLIVVKRDEIEVPVRVRRIPKVPNPEYLAAPPDR